MRLRRRERFDRLIDLQLDLFARESAGALAGVDAALRAYDAADANDAEERYGDVVDAVDAVREELEDLRDVYARTLDADTAELYAVAFGRRARRQFPRIASELE